MTTETLHTSRSGGPLGFFRQLLGQLSARAAERRSLAALRRLDDRLLGDVGLTRAEVDAMTDGL